MTGRVQGVGFRWWAQRIGSELGLGGHVCNLPDGSVEVHVRGSAEGVEAFEKALGHGPRAARVESVQSVDPDPRTPATQFLMEVW